MSDKTNVGLNENKFKNRQLSTGEETLNLYSREVSTVDEALELMKPSNADKFQFFCQ